MGFFDRLLGRAPLDATLSHQMRATLYGELPLEAWTGGDAAGSPPWSTFALAREHLAAGRTAEAAAAWQEIAAQPGLESRHYAQSWFYLRTHAKVQPPAMLAKRVLGVVVEVGLPKGLDLLAAYEDGSARYYNFSGKAIIWERPDDSLEAPIRALLDSATALAGKIGPWDRELPAAASNGVLRLSMLTPSGLHFGQGAIGDLQRDPIGAPTFRAATGLMEKLMDKALEK